MSARDWTEGGIWVPVRLTVDEITWLGFFERHLPIAEGAVGHQEGLRRLLDLKLLSFDDQHRTYTITGEGKFVLQADIEASQKAEDRAAEMANAPSLTLHVKQESASLFYVTSPNDKGLLAAGHTLQEALAEVGPAMAALAQARSEHGPTFAGRRG